MENRETYRGFYFVIPTLAMAKVATASYHSPRLKPVASCIRSLVCMCIRKVYRARVHTYPRGGDARGRHRDSKLALS